MPAIYSARHDRMKYGDIKLYTGTSCPELAAGIARYIGSQLCDREIVQFPNENLFIQLHSSVRGQDCYAIQTTSAPVHRNLMELLILLQTLRLDSAARVTAVVPYLCYARSDKKDQPRIPITARLVADMIEAAGADRYIFLDLHAGQIQGFFNIPGDVLTAFYTLIEYLKEKKTEMYRPVVLTADLGFAKKARNIAQILDAPVAFVEKRRTGASTESLAVIGDVAGCNVLIVDDEVDRGGTMAGDAEIVRQAGAQDVYSCFVHATFSEGAAQRMAEANFAEIVCTNSTPITPAKQLPNMTVIHLGRWLATIIDAVHSGRSVGRTLSEYGLEH